MRKKVKAISLLLEIFRMTGNKNRIYISFRAYFTALYLDFFFNISLHIL